MRWLKWSLLEAVARTASLTLIKVIGNLSAGLSQVTFTTLIIGAVQTLAGGIIFHRRPRELLPSRRLVVGSVLFGIGAVFNSLIAFMAFVYDANITVYTLLTLLAIVPGAVIDRMWFGEKLVLRQGLGVATALVAGWLVLGAPNLTKLLSLPLWAWLGIVNAVGLAINQGVTRWIKEVDVWVKNFWGGLTTLLLSLTILAVLGETRETILAWPGLETLFFWSIIISFAVIGIWSFNVTAYRDGAAIPPKHVVVNGTFLSLVVFVGLLFGDVVTPIQIIGMVIYLGAFALVNNAVWQYITAPHSKHPH